MASDSPPEQRDDGAGAEERYASRDQLRALAHPLRLEIMTRIGRRGTARAADIAEDLGLPANSVSYHLRTLARGGVIQEAPEAARDRRDRVWKLAQHSFEHGRRSGVDPAAVDEDYLAASGATSLAGLDWFRAAWIANLADHRDHHSADDPRRGLGSLQAMDLRLSPEQAEEFVGRVTDLIQEMHRLNRDESGADVPGDPDSDDEARDFRLLFGLTATHPEAVPRSDPSRDGS
ncbi:MAG: helix-turn-helix domain-containing protein [Brachybacterium sp.]|nr:helix-turn-helix domain-containing protein [Brachybacterium sp.]